MRSISSSPERVMDDDEEDYPSRSPSPSPSPHHHHHHHHHLSSLIVRPSSDHSAGGGGSDYESGEVRPDPDPDHPRFSRYSTPPRSDRYQDSPPPSPPQRSDRYPASPLVRPDRYLGSPPSRTNRYPTSPLLPPPPPPPPRSDRYPGSPPSRSDRYLGSPPLPLPPPPPRSDRYLGSPPPRPDRYLGSPHTDRYPGSPPGRGMRARSISPLRHRKGDHQYKSDFNNSSRPLRGRGFVSGRGPGRFQDFSPPYGRGRGGGRFAARDFDGPEFDHGSLRDDSMSRNNPNVPPREGDWICPDPVCGNLNFARRDYCNHCDRPRFGPRGSPRRNFPGPPRFPGPPMDRTPPRGINGHRSPPRGWSRDGPRDFAAAPPLRNGGRFPDHTRRDGPNYREEDHRERRRFDRPMPPDWGQRGRRENFSDERRGFDMRNDRRPLSPPLPPPPPPLPHGRWPRDSRDRSRSPIRGLPPKDHRRDLFVNRGRGGRWGVSRGRLGVRPY